MNPEVTIITVCRNAASTIRQTMDSVLRLSDERMEYVVVDGASVDGTPAILVEYEKRFRGRMKWISEPDRGIYDAMNKGLRMSSGRWINYQNDGDLLSSVPYEELKSAFADGCGLLSCAVESEDGVQHSRVSLITRCRNTIPHQGAFYLRSVVELLNGYDASYKILGDHDLNLRILRGKSPIRISETVCAFHSVRGVSSIGGASIKAEMRRVVRENYGSCMMCLAWVENKMFGLHQWLESHSLCARSRVREMTRRIS